MSISSSRRVPAATPDEGRYLDEAVIASVEAFLARCKQREVPADCSRDETFRIEQLLYHEAALLDARRYLDWVELLDDDFVYWIPSVAGASSPRAQVSVNFDDRRRLLDRIAYTTSGVQWAQVPPSRTARSLANVRGWRAPGGDYEASASLTLWAHRRGTTSCFVGHQHVLLRPHGDTLRIRTRIIELLDCDQPQGNNSFIL